MHIHLNGLESDWYFYNVMDVSHSLWYNLKLIHPILHNYITLNYEKAALKNLGLKRSNQHEISRTNLRSHKPTRDLTNKHEISQTNTRSHKPTRDLTNQHKISRTNKRSHKPTRYLTNQQEISQTNKRSHKPTRDLTERISISPSSKSHLLWTFYSLYCNIISISTTSARMYYLCL